MQGVPAHGVIDSGADITIVGGELFRKVAAVARLKKSQLKTVDKIPHTYDRKTFKLDGRVDLDSTFGDTTMNTPVYIKMDSLEPLLLAEGVCRQLGVISYLPDVVTGNLHQKSDRVRAPPGTPNPVPDEELREANNGAAKHNTTPCQRARNSDTTDIEVPENPEKSPQTETHTCSPELPPQPTTRDGELARTDRETQTDTLPPVEPASPVVNGAVVELDAAVVPTVRVWLSQTVRVPANQNAVVPVGKCARRIPTPDAASGDVPKPGGWPRLCLRISR